MQKLPVSLETERLLLRRLKYEDAEEIFYAYASKLEATRFVSWPVHQTVADTTSYLKSAVESWNIGLSYSYAIRTKSDNRLIGSIGMINDNGNVQFGYIFSPSVWNMGYATESVTELLRQLIMLDGVYRIWTFVDVENLSSQRVLQKTGMVEEARLNKWRRFVNQNNQPRDCVLYMWPKLK